MRHSQKLKALERRRLRGARLLGAGHSRAEVARKVGVSRQTVMRWDRARQEGGVEGLRRSAHFGRPERLRLEQRAELVRVLKAGAVAAGFGTELWTVPRIAQVIRERFAVSMVSTSVWRLLGRLLGRLGWSVQRPTGQARERNERAIRTWQRKWSSSRHCRQRSARSC